MADQHFPNPALPIGDDSQLSPRTNDRSILGIQKDTQVTRRLTTDADRNLYVHVAADDTAGNIPVTPLANGSVTSVPASTLTTIATYAAASDVKISRVGCSGTIYAKYQIFIDTVLIETKRSSPERSIDFIFHNPLALTAGQVLDVKMTHYFTGSLEDFDTTIYGG